MADLETELKNALRRIERLEAKIERFTHSSKVWLDDSAVSGVLSPRHGGTGLTNAVLNLVLESLTTTKQSMLLRGVGTQRIATISELNTALVNEIRNFPSLERADDAQPEWWEEADANAALTEVDLAGETGISELRERALKLVVSSAASYAYQRYTYADEPRLKSGQRVSFSCYVWSVSGISASIELADSNGVIATSSATTTANWTKLTLENKLIGGTYVEIRLKADVGTAYFIPLSFHIGAKAVSLPERKLVYRSAGVNKPITRTLSGSTGDAGFTDRDLTTNTSPLAVFAHLRVNMEDLTTSDNFFYQARAKGSTDTGGHTEIAQAKGNTSSRGITEWLQWLNDQQVYQDFLQRVAGTGSLDFGIVILLGWWEWE